MRIVADGCTIVSHPTTCNALSHRNDSQGIRIRVRIVGQDIKVINHGCSSIFCDRHAIVDCDRELIVALVNTERRIVCRDRHDIKYADTGREQAEITIHNQAVVNMAKNS